jgi:hypothetical protein
MKFRPTKSELLAIPVGWELLALRKSNAAELIAPQATTTMAAV